MAVRLASGQNVWRRSLTCVLKFVFRQKPPDVFAEDHLQLPRVEYTGFLEQSALFG
ncbi:MAG TPA: hypothetical protein VK776_12025 [Bryobacteraceae bacterium]|nr:hypothetical protein [Bryobacteraceae bacterium]